MTRPEAPRERMRRDQNLALGCAVAVALLVMVTLIAYLWTL
jgi:hypothetical protein